MIIAKVGFYMQVGICGNKIFLVCNTECFEVGIGYVSFESNVYIIAFERSSNGKVASEHITPAIHFRINLTIPQVYITAYAAKLVAVVLEIANVGGESEAGLWRKEVGSFAVYGYFAGERRQSHIWQEVL